MYAGALFITQIFQWDLYGSVIFILGITALYTVIGIQLLYYDIVCIFPIQTNFLTNFMIFIRQS